MSLSAEGRIIYCDGSECCASVPAPVALRRSGAGKTGETPPDASNWLFVDRKGITHHYCPRCIPRYLRQVTGATKKAIEQVQMP